MPIWLTPTTQFHTQTLRTYFPVNHNIQFAYYQAKELPARAISPLLA